MRYAGLVFILIACSSTIHKASHLDESVHVNKMEQQTGNTSSQEQKHQDASEVDTQEEDLGVEVQDDKGAITIAKVTPAHPLKIPAGSKVIGSIPLKTITKDQKIGAKTDDTQATSKFTKTDEDKMVLTKKLDTTEQDTHSFGPGLKFYLWALLALIVVLCAGYIYLKFIRKAIPL